MFKNNGSYKTFLVIFLIGLALRILFVLTLEDKIYWDDGFDYDGLATRLIEGKGYVDKDGEFTAFRAPGYPFFLTAIYTIFGHHFLAVRFVQCLLNAVTIIFIFFITRLIFNQSAAIISALLFAVYPLFVYTTSTFFPTTVFIFLLSIIMFLILSIEKKQTTLKVVMLGVMLGLAALTVPTVLVFVPFALSWILFGRRNLNLKTIFSCVVILLSTILTLSPWLLRNFKVYHKPFVIATNGGYNFWMGNNQWASASSGNSIQRPEYLLKKLNQAGSDTQKESIYYQDALEYIKKHPGRLVTLTFKKALNLWRLYPTPDTGYKTNALLSKIIGAMSFGPVLFLAILGILLSWRQKKKYSILFILLFFSFTMMHSLFITKVRFRLPLDPYLIIIASYALSELKIKALKV